MKGIFWNSRGLSDLAKARFLRDTSREQNLDFITLLETCKKDFSQETLNNFSGGRNFVWHWTAPHGRSGGILLGVNLDAMDVGGIDDGDFYVKFKLRDRKSDFKWVLVAMYGAAQREFKEAFLTELVHSCRNERLPLCIGGDFNIIRNSSEKNNDRFEERWPFLFNVVIDSLDLREIEMPGRKFTWANSRRVPTYEKLDRVLVSTEWEQNFPSATVNALSREISDHEPLLLSAGDKSKGPSQLPFKFELGWLLKDGFFELVSEVWTKENKGATSMQKWQNKIRRLRQFLRGWAKNMNGAYKKEKQELMRKAEELDKKAVTQLLSQQDWDLKQSINSRLTQLLREEEIRWFQRAKTTKILKGDNNTKYFQMVANGKRRKTRIFRLEQEEGIVEGEEHLNKYITNYYKGLFGESKCNNLSLNESMVEDIPQVTPLENEFLEVEFSEKEVREAVFQMKHNKAPGPDGFPVEFYQVFWSLIKKT
jgi:exonuclease III